MCDKYMLTWTLVYGLSKYQKSYLNLADYSQKNI